MKFEATMIKTNINYRDMFERIFQFRPDGLLMLCFKGNEYQFSTDGLLDENDILNAIKSLQDLHAQHFSNAEIKPTVNQVGNA